MSRVASVFLTLVAATAAAYAYDSPPAAGGAPQAQISAQPLADALTMLARQSGLQIIYGSEVVRGRQSKGAPAGLSVPQTLAHVLEGTDLEFEFLNERTVTIWIKGQERPVRRDMRESKVSSGDAASSLRLAQAQTGQLQAMRTSGPAEKVADSKGMPEMLVKGKRSSNTDIERTEDDVQPYVVFQAAEIERSMAGNLEEFLITRLPMNASLRTNAQGVGSPLGNQSSSLDLRGLGADQTLILVNGRRMPGIFLTSGGDFRQPDINGIALSSVERIEVLPSTAGGIYGGGATGGVINIVLKSDYRGIALRGRYDNTFDSDAGQRRLEASAGFSLEDGRTHIMLTGSHMDSNVLSVGDRDFINRGRALQLKNNPAVFYGTTTPPLGATSNIRSNDGTNLILKSNNQSLGSPITFVPRGYAGPASDSGAAFIANAGKYNLDMPLGVQGAERSLLANPTVSSTTLNVRRSFTDRFEAFSDFSFYRNRAHSDFGGIATSGTPTTPGMITIPASAPNNPFRQAIRVRFLASDFTYGDNTEATSETLRAGGGLIVRLPRDWTVQGEYAWSRSRSLFLGTSPNFIPDGTAAMADGRLNILRDVDSFPLDYSPYYLLPSPNNILGPVDTVLTNPILRLAGPVLHLPGGPLMVSALLERREQQLRRVLIETHSVPGAADYSYFPPRGQSTDSAYVEATVPLISAANARSFARLLDFQASYRYDTTDTQAVDSISVTAFLIPSPDGPFPATIYNINTVEANQYTLGLRYKPVDRLALRLSYGAGILPPSLSQLVPSLINNQAVVAQFLSVLYGNPTDPKRGNTVIPPFPLLKTSGNHNLVPEQSASWSAGAVFTPRFLEGLRLSVDYTRIRKTDEIESIAMQSLMDLEGSFPGRIVRAALTPADNAQNYTGGVIQSVDLGLVNIAFSEVEAFDIQADYDWDSAYGTFHANVLASYQPHLKQRILQSSPVTDSVGYTSGPLEWRGNGGLTWERGAWTAGWNMQYYASYLIYTVTSSAASRATAILNQGSNRIPRQVYHDLSVKYRFDENQLFWRGMLSNSEIQLGIGNVFDTSPPILALSGTTGVFGGGYSTFGDPRMRRYSISLRKSFE